MLESSTLHARSARARADGTSFRHFAAPRLKIAAELRVLRSGRIKRPRERRGLAYSARARALHLHSPRPADPSRNTAERSSNDLSRGPKKRRTPRNIGAFSARKIYQTAPLCQAEAPGSSARKPWIPRRSGARARARKPAPARPASARNARRRAATAARLHIPCHRVMRCCVGVAAILTFASAIHRRPRRIPAPRRTLRHPEERGIPCPVLGNRDAVRAPGFTETCASAGRARSP